MNREEWSAYTKTKTPSEYLSDVGLGVNLRIKKWPSVYILNFRERTAGPPYFIGPRKALWSLLYDMRGIAFFLEGTKL